MKNVYHEIISWAKELPYWEQAALDKILSRIDFDDNDYDELLQYLLEDENLVDESHSRPSISLFRDTPDLKDIHKKVLLKEILELENVNALVPNQKLTFGENLTAVFGRNGSGKSGYARVLGSAGFTRGDQDVLLDITKPFDKEQPIRAKIKVSIDEEEQVITHEIGKSCPALSSFYVFDSTSVIVHMTGKNSFSFSPAGLSLLTELSSVTDVVRSHLKAKIAELEQPSDFERYFAGESEVQEKVKNIGVETDIEKLAALAKLSTEDEKRIHELEVEIGSIGLGHYQNELEQKKLDLKNIKELHNWLSEAGNVLNPQKITDINAKILRYQEVQTRAREVSIEQFQHDKFTQTGTELWNEFIYIAHQLAESESRNRDSYPNEEDICLLCQQPLSGDAQQLILRLWEYLAGDVRTELLEIDAEMDQLSKSIKNNEKFPLSKDHSTSITAVAKTHKNLSSKITEQVETIIQCVENLLIGLSNREIIQFKNGLPENCSQDIFALIKILEDQIIEWEQKDVVSQSQRLEQERRTLEHRKKLKELLPQIESYVNQRIWAQKASKVGGSTRHITKKFNELFDRLVKNRYIEIFEETLKTLGRSLQVEIVTSGRKGETLKQIQLKAHKTAGEIADPEKVLSEGEKRAVALADFLTEAALDTTSAGVVLDDPVTSLDLEWRKTIANILAQEATHRQVIVFTHDMPFLYQLMKCVEESQIDKKVHWITRGDGDDLPGYVHNDNCPVLEQEYKTSQPAREFYTKAKAADSAKVQEALIREGMAALRTSYEALVVYEVFGGVVTRFEERISIGRITGLVWNDEVLNEIDTNYSRLSRYITGHLHSDALAEPLKTEMLKAEFETFDALKNKIKELKKLKSQSGS